MRACLAIAFLLAAAAPAAAQLVPPQHAPGQAPVGLPAQGFAFFHCFCDTSPGAPLPSQLTFAPQPTRQWTGSVYATSVRDAMSKAGNACTVERRGSLFDCLNCRCDQ